MSFFKSKGVSVAGIVTAIPKNKIPTDSFIGEFGEEAIEAFKNNTKIETTYRVLPDQTASDLGYAASKCLIEKLGVDKEAIGAIIFVSQAPDYRKPATACVLQYRLGLSMDCAAYDVNMGCSGFIYGHQIMQSFMMHSDCKYGLLIVAESATKILNMHDQGTAMLFGDAGSAILYENGTDEECATLLKTDGSRFKSLIVPAGGFRDLNPEISTYIDPDGKERSKFTNYMDGMGVFAFSITEVPIAMKEYLQRTNHVANDFDYVFLHQANYMILKQIARRIKADIAKVPISLDRYGNTGGVTIPLGICDMLGNVSDGKVNILASGFGIGLSLGVTSFVIDAAKVFPIIETDEVFTEGKY